MRMYHYLSSVLLCLALLVGSIAGQTPSPSGQVKKAFLTRRGEQLLMDGKPFRAVGVNKWELLDQYVGDLYGDDLKISKRPAETSKRLALKALDDMASHGINVILVKGCPFYSAQMQKTYLGDEERRRIFWQRFDEMLDDCAQRQIRVILSIGFSYSLWPDIAHESLDEFVCNPHSKSRRLFDQWVRDLTGRYKDNATILFWELLTEGNLYVDLRPQKPEGVLHATPEHLTPGPVVRDDRNHMTADELAAFHRETTHLIKSIDPNHMVGTGYAMPRHSSWHLWMGSCRRATKMDWTLDTDEQRADYLRLITPEVVDLMCVHFYLGSPEKNKLEHLALLARVASELKKPLYIGESGPYFPDAVHEEVYAKKSARVRLHCILEAARILDVQIAMAWDWDEDCSIPHEPVIWPDKYPEVVALIKTAQAKAKSIATLRNPGVSPEAVRRLRELDTTWQSVFEAEQKWKLGVQTGSFAPLTFFESITRAEALGLKYIEPHPWEKLSPARPDAPFNHNCPPDVLEAAQQRLDQAGIQLASYWFLPDRGDLDFRRIFQFAKQIGVETIACEPPPDKLKLLDKLAAEYGMNVAIHNRPKGHQSLPPDYPYWSPDGVLEAIKGCSQRMGVYVDTGHWARSGVEPIESLRKLKGRIITVHLKDVDKAALSARDVPLGTGVANIKGILSELYRQKFAGIFVIEYESNRPNNTAEVAQCIKYFNEVSRELGH